MLWRDREKGIFALLQLIKVHSVRYSVATAIEVLMTQKWMRLKEKSSGRIFVYNLKMVFYACTAQEHIMYDWIFLYKRLQWRLYALGNLGRLSGHQKLGMVNTCMHVSIPTAVLLSLSLYYSAKYYFAFVLKHNTNPHIFSDKSAPEYQATCIFYLHLCK